MKKSSDDLTRRNSVPDEPELVADPVSKAEIEARNGFRQFDLGMHMVEDALAKGHDFRWRPSLIQSLHREALQGLSKFAGHWRPAGVAIENSKHQPIGAHLVAEEIESMCDYLNAHMQSKSAIHMAAFAMWRLNWIHPFSDGNGRTSRIFSYAVLCVKLGFVLRGANTIPDQIVANRSPYFDALDFADEAWRSKIVDVSAMETLLERLLAVQLTSVFDQATGKAHGA